MHKVRAHQGDGEDFFKIIGRLYIVVVDLFLLFPLRLQTCFQLWQEGVQGRRLRETGFSGVFPWLSWQETPTQCRVVMSKKKGQAKVTIYPDWCKGCGICAAFCPAGVLELRPDGKAHVVRESECVNCGFCELHCPDFAISVTPRDPGRRKTDQDPDPRAQEFAAPGNPDPGPEEIIRTPNREDEHGHQKA